MGHGGTSVARPRLFMRPLEQGEMEYLAHLRKSRRQAVRQRAQILMASMVYTPVSQIALSPPTTLGEPLTHWSLRRLKGHLERRRVVPRIAIETLRRILRDKHVTFQRTRSWKRS